MNKFCCCADPELPNLSFNVTCACCQSKVDEHTAKDTPDFNVDEIDGREDQISCCFRLCRKRHAKSRRDKKKKNTDIQLSDGTDA